LGILASPVLQFFTLFCLLLKLLHSLGARTYMGGSNKTLIGFACQTKGSSALWASKFRPLNLANSQFVAKGEIA
jgi:hypothetical protein